jgi:APA family basic amino acid/polyamine antiporter
LNGIALGAASVFFAYIGFDAVSTAAQEAKNPQKDMPIGILGSLAVCTVLYIIVSTILTGLKNYKELERGRPGGAGHQGDGRRLGRVAGEDRRGVWAGNRDAGDAAGPVARVLLDVEGRIAAQVGLGHSSQVPHAVDFNDCVGAIVAIMPGFLPIDQLAKLVNIGTLLAFTIVCAGVWVLRVRHPDLHRPFKTPLVPAGADSGDHFGVLPDDAASADHLGSDDWLAAGGAGDLLWLFEEPQQGAETADHQISG